MTIIFITVGVCLAVWGTVLALRGSLLVGCCAYLIAGSCLAGRFYSLDAAGLTWSLDRILLMGLVVAFVLQWRLGRVEIKPWCQLDALFAIFYGLLLVSTFTHDWRGAGTESNSVIMHLVNGYVIPLCLYLIARHARLDERQMRQSYLLLGLFGVYLAITACLEITGQWSLVFPRYIADPEQGIHFGRARGPMVQSARFGLYLIACLGASWILLIWQGAWGRKGWLLAAALVPLYMAGLYFTYTRSVWMGTAMSTVVIIGLTMRGKLRMAMLGGMFASMLIVVLVKGDQLVAFKREHTAAETRDSTYMRARFFYVSTQMFKDRPLTGFGFGQYQTANHPYLSDRSTEMRLESIRGYIHHNTLLSLLVELGIFGLALFLFVFAYWIRDAWKLWRTMNAPAWMRGHALLMLVTLPPYTAQLMFREVSYSTEENSLLFLFAGITSGMRFMLESRSSRDSHARPSTRGEWLRGAGPSWSP